MSIKSDSDLALADKIDLARTLIRFKARRKAIHELNEIEDKITKAHDAEVSRGSFTQIDLDAIGVGSLAKELPSGNDTDESSSRKAGNKSS